MKMSYPIAYWDTKTERTELNHELHHMSQRQTVISIQLSIKQICFTLSKGE